MGLRDRVRAPGLDGMLHASRTRPDRAHLTLFRWNAAGGGTVHRAGPDLPDADGPGRPLRR